MATITACVVGTQKVESVFTRNSTIPHHVPSALRAGATPSHSHSAAADWPIGTPPSGPARHKHVPRPFRNKTTRHANKCIKVNQFQCRWLIQYVVQSDNILYKLTENSYTAYMAAHTTNTYATHDTANSFMYAHNPYPFVSKRFLAIEDEQNGGYRPIVEAFSTFILWATRANTSSHNLAGFPHHQYRVSSHRNLLT